MGFNTTSKATCAICAVKRDNHQDAMTLAPLQRVLRAEENDREVFAFKDSA